MFLGDQAMLLEPMLAASGLTANENKSMKTFCLMKAIWVLAKYVLIYNMFDFIILHTHVFWIFAAMRR